MKGRSAAFVTMYEAHYGAVHAYAARRVGSDAADELTAETFLVAWRRWDAVPAEPLPWLYGVARHVVLRYHEASGRQQRARAALQDEPVFAADGAETTEDPRLWAAWAQLRPGDQEVLSLVAWEELTVAEAAGVLGCSAAVFSVRLHRARRRLARLLLTAPTTLTATTLTEG